VQQLKHGDRKTDMTLEQLEPAHDASVLGRRREPQHLGRRADDAQRSFPRWSSCSTRLPRMRKIGINTTGLTPHRAIPMLTRIVKFCAEHDLLISVRVSLDGIGDIHDQVRHVEARLRQGSSDDRGDAALADEYRTSSSASRRRSSRQPGRSQEHSRRGRATKNLDIVFNMLRSPTRCEQQGAPGHRSASTSAEEDFMRKFFLDRVQENRS
jgi:hypothetical protein